ncbi:MULTISPECIES: DUF3099 domain-containing protein [unclassified Streptomyces]|uniref:DUF3099 domain-containing protein n=1 Tax=unclassified Streptomyces TaxID=2593676 RepID=UPI003830E26E
MTRKHSDDQVFRITGAAAGLSDDVRARQRRYIISMSIRTVSFVLAVVLWQVSTPLAWITLVLGLVLPYIEVVVANAGRENARGLPRTHIAPPERPALGPGETSLPSERAPGTRQPVQ